MQQERVEFQKEKKDVIFVLVSVSNFKHLADKKSSAIKKFPI